MADPSISELQRAESDAAWKWRVARDINSGNGKESAEAARVNHQLALVNLNRALKAQAANG